MRVFVTPSARAELLRVVVAIRGRDRRAAARFLADVETTIGAVVDGIESGPEIESPWRSAGAPDGHRLYLRERKNRLWLIALWPDPIMRAETESHGKIS